MANKKDILKEIKENSPQVYAMLMEQQKIKWDITKGRDFPTIDSSCKTSNQEQLLEQIKQIHV